MSKQFNQEEELTYFTEKEFKSFTSKDLHQTWFRNDRIREIIYSSEELDTKIILKFTIKGELKSHNLDILHKKLNRDNYKTIFNKIKIYKQKKPNLIQRLFQSLILFFFPFFLSDEKSKKNKKHNNTISQNIKNPNNTIPLQINQEQSDVLEKENNPPRQVNYEYTYYDDGNKRSKLIIWEEEESYSHKNHRYRTMWYKNGLLEYQYNFKEHLVYRWYENGQLISFGDEEWYESGKIKRRGSKEWYENGQLKSFGDEEWYESGKIKKDGPKEWYENGNLLKDGCLEFDIDGKLLKDDCFEYDSQGNYIEQLSQSIENYNIGRKEWFQSGNIKYCVLGPFIINWNEDGSFKSLMFKNYSEQVKDVLTVYNQPKILGETKVMYEILDMSHLRTYRYPH